jgi:DNA repair protein RecO (recombination protein O)
MISGSQAGVRACLSLKNRCNPFTMVRWRERWIFSGPACVKKPADSMKTFETEAIVLSTRDYGESDRLVTFHTLAKGKVCGIAKGARRSVKRFANSFEPCSLVDLVCSDRRSLAWIETCKLVEPYQETRTEVQRWGYAALLSEIVLEGVPEREPQPELFLLLRGALGQLTQDKDPLNVVLLFVLRFQALMGYMPALDGCAVCGRQLDACVRWWWRVGQGALVCTEHQASERGCICLNRGTLALINQSRKLPLEKIWRLRVLQESKAPLFHALLDWVRSCTGKDLKSLKMLEQVQAGLAGHKERFCPPAGGRAVPKPTFPERI